MKRVGVDLTRCVGCGVCVRACPLGVLELSEGHAAVNARRHCMECMHCAAACPVRAITWEGLSPEALYVPTPEDPVVRAVMTRRSTRHFRPDCPDRALLARVLDAAEYAPSSKNEHKNRWTVVLGKDKTDALIDPVVAWGEANGRPELKKQRERGINMITCGAPCLIVGHIPMTANNPEGDVVIAISLPRYSSRTIQLMDFARDSGAEVVAITDSLDAPAAKRANHVLLAKSDMVSVVDSLVAPMSLANALIVAIGQRKKGELSRIFENLEGIWQEYEVYERVET